MSGSRRRTASAIGVVAALASVALATTTPAAVAAPLNAPGASSGTHGDFNGDGFGDLVASAPDAALDGQAGAGAVAVAYGSPDGPGSTDADRATLSQATPGISGAPETDDHFGKALAVGDYDGDGFSDVAVGTPGEDVGKDHNAGAIQILWGSTEGLTGASTWLPEPARSDHDAHGRALAAGDFDGDGRTDLASGNTSSQAWLFAGGFTRSGDTGGTHPLGSLNTWNFEVDALTAGDLTGDGADDLLVSHMNLYTTSEGENTTLGLELQGGVGAHDAYFSMFGDLNCDGYGDLVISREGDGGGEYTVFPGAPESESDPTWRIDYDRRTTTNQHQFGYPGDADSHDAFASTMAVGDIDGDGCQELIVGDPREDRGTATDAGFVVLDTPTWDWNTLDQGTAGVPGANEAGDGFGSFVSLSDLNGDGKDDLALAVGEENGGNGSVLWFPSTGDRIGTDGARALGSADFGVPTAGSPHLGDSIH